MVWIWVMAVIFVLGVAWLLMGNPWNTIYDKFYPVLDAEYQPTAQKINSLWNTGPIFVILIVVLIGVLLTTRRQTDSGYY